MDCQGLSATGKTIIVAKDLRRSHFLAVEDDLSEFKADTGVVNGGRNHA